MLAEAEASFEALAAVVMTVPLDVATQPGRLPWLDGQALVDLDPGRHLALHELDVRRWLAQETIS